MQRRNWWSRLKCWLGMHDVITYYGGRYGIGCVCHRCRAIVPVRHRGRWR